MAPDSLTPAPADGTGGPTPPVADLISRIQQEMTRIEQESQKLKDQAAEKDRQLAEMRVRLATLAGSKNHILKTPQIGQMIPGKGIFAGLWNPKNREGNSLGTTFAVYAAPQDLTDESGKKVLSTFKDTARHVTGLRNWHGHDGGDFANDTALFKGLADGSAIGKWFIPTRELLKDNLCANKHEIGGFQTSGSGLFVWYWSCTEHRDDTSYVWNTRFSDGDDDWDLNDIYRLSCRPCLVEALSI
jgi:hypothetical protein